MNNLNYFNPMVSIVVPNYNHAKFLKKRLDSIYSQTYNNYEVILLDDCSSDGSQNILKEYAEKYSLNTRYVPNLQNSGGVFHQWKKAFEISKGDLIWIAESDDFAANNFLEALVPFFEDDIVNLAYCYSLFIDHNDNSIAYSFESHTSVIDEYKWQKNYVNTAANEVDIALSIKNTIPNVSSVLMRKKNLNIFNDLDWLNMKICGDWILYLELIRSGKLAFSKDTTNYFRFHGNNSSGKTYKTFAYVKEHQKVAEFIAQHYICSENSFTEFVKELKNFWNLNIADCTTDAFEDYFDVSVIKNMRTLRKKNIIVGLVSFLYGGGELYPIRLANELYKRGYAVTLFNYNIYDSNHDVRSLVHKNIPVINWNKKDSADTILSEYKIELVNTHYEAVDRFFALRRDIINIKQVISTHGMYEIMFKENIKNFEYISKNFLAVNYWIYTADKNLEPFYDSNLFDYNRFIKVDNGFSPQFMNSVSRKDLGIADDEFVICLVSRAIPTKGWDIAIQSFNLANNKLKGKKKIRLLLIGEGTVYDELKNTNLSDNIRLLGFRKNTIDYYAISDVGILPTTFPGESFPLCLIECMFAERPVIATNIGEISYMVTRENRSAGILIDVQDKHLSEKFADAIVDFAENIEEYQKYKDNTLFCVERFDFKYVGNEYEKVFNLAFTNSFPHLGAYYQLYYNDRICNLANLDNLYIYLHYDNNNGFNGNDCVSLPVLKTVNSYEFDISKLTNVKGLRIDPINAPAHITLNGVYLVDNSGYSRYLKIKWHNADEVIKNQYSFYHDDPIWIFDFESNNTWDYTKLILNLDIELIDIHEMSNFINDVKSKLIDMDHKLIEANHELVITHNELIESNHELVTTNNELTNVYHSKSWKITKPLRKLLSFVK